MLRKLLDKVSFLCKTLPSPRYLFPLTKGLFLFYKSWIICFELHVSSDFGISAKLILWTREYIQSHIN